MPNENLLPFLELGQRLRDEAYRATTFQEILALQYREHTWFTPFFVDEAITHIANALVEEQLQAFAVYAHPEVPKTISVVPSGTTPLENFYDLFYILAAGHNYRGKLAPKDRRLLPFLAELLFEIEPAFRERLSFTEQLGKFDAAIIDGQAEQAPLLQQYLSRFPNVIRTACTSVAVLTGAESEAQLRNLSRDIYLFFGNSERSVSKLWVPRDYDFVPLIHALHEESSCISDHNQFLNHLDYQKSIRLMNNLYYMDAGTFLLLESPELRPAISVVNYEYYDDLSLVPGVLATQQDNIQHIMAEVHLPGLTTLPFGCSHTHPLSDYTCNKNIFKFLTELS